MLLIVEKSRHHEFKNLKDHGQPVNQDDAVRMMELYVERVQRSADHDQTGIDMGQEPSHVFFSAGVLKNLKDWGNVGIAFALAVQPTAGGDHRPPTVDEADDWRADPSSITLVQTAIIAEADDDGNFLFEQDTTYQMYDFAGQCCHLQATLDEKKSCIRQSFKRPKDAVRRGINGSNGTTSTAKKPLSKPNKS